MSPLVVELWAWSADSPGQESPVIGLKLTETQARFHISTRLSGRGDRPGAWALANVPRERRQKPLHALRATFRTGLLFVGVPEIVIDFLIGHQLRGTGGRHYTASWALEERAREAVALVPSIGSGS